MTLEKEKLTQRAVRLSDTEWEFIQLKAQEATERKGDGTKFFASDVMRHAIREYIDKELASENA